MKLLAAFLLMSAMALTGCDPKPFPPDDPRLIPLRTFAKANHLMWHVSINGIGVKFYCVSLQDSANRAVVKCDDPLDDAVKIVIKEWDHPVIPWAGVGEDLRTVKP